MAKRYKHRKPHYLRAAAILAWALQGLFAPWTQTPVYAANPDTLTIGMRGRSTAPPAAIADLLASPNPVIPGQVSLSWTAPQGNAGGTPINNLTVESYSVHYATYSVDSLLGNTTAWWNSTMASSTTLQAPTNTPQAPGSLEGFTFNGLTPAVTYYFGIRSTSPFGALSPIDTLAATPTLQAHAIAPYNAIPPPTVFTGVALSTGSILWSWISVSSATVYQVYSHPPNVLLQTLTAPTSSWIETGLSANTAYSRKVRASDGVATSSDSLVATVTTLSGGSSAVPQMPNGVLSTLSPNGLQATLSWTPVTRDDAGGAIGIDHYTIWRYDAIGSTPTVSFTAPGSVPAYTDTTNGTVYYYRIQAISSGGQPSALSDYLDSSSAANRYALASDDIATRVVMPREAASYILAANNPYGEDLQIILTHRPQDEGNVTLRSYAITVGRASNGVVIPQFSFPLNNIDVHLGYGAVVSPSGRLTLNSPSKISAAALAQIISVYWYNGGSYIRVGSPILTIDQSLSVTVRNLGIYQIRAASLGSDFRLTQGSPYPRVITPNGAENRRVFWFYDNPTGDPVKGEIFDIRGAHVRTLVVNGMSPTPNSLVWDAHDDNGAVVPSGIYLYKISTTEQTVTGTVVVAR